jgi:hypothetical protein
MIRRKSPESVVSSVLRSQIFATQADDATSSARLGLTPYTSVFANVGNIAISNMASPNGLSSYATGNTFGLNDNNTNAFNLPNITGCWLVNLQWTGALTITSAPTVSATGPGVVSASFPAFGMFPAAATTASLAFVGTTVKVSPVSVGVSTNLFTIGGLATMTSGNFTMIISRVNDAFVERKTEIDRLSELENLVRELTLRNVDDWNCRPSEDDRRRPRIPLRTVEPDEKSLASQKSKPFK